MENPQTISALDGFLKECYSMDDSTIGTFVVKTIRDGKLLDKEGLPRRGAVAQIGALVRSIAFEHVRAYENPDVCPVLTHAEEDAIEEVIRKRDEQRASKSPGQ